MMPIILAFAGGVGSGKSTVSSAVARDLGWPRTSFGAYVRAKAQSRGLNPRAREVLQAIGEQLVKDECATFCSAVLSCPDWRRGQPLVVDGIRHVEVLEQIRRMVAPQEVQLVFIEVTDEERAARLQDRGLDDPAQLRSIEAHSTETQVRTVLPHMADKVVDGDRPLDEVVQDVVAWVRGGAEPEIRSRPSRGRDLISGSGSAVPVAGQAVPSPLSQSQRVRKVLAHGVAFVGLFVVLPLVVTIVGTVIYDLYLKPRLPLLPRAYHALSSFLSVFLVVVLLVGGALLIARQRRRIGTLKEQNEVLGRREVDLMGHCAELGDAQKALTREKARFMRRCDSLDVQATLLEKQLALDEAILGFIPYLSLSTDREDTMRKCLSNFLDGTSALLGNEVFRALIVQPTEVDGSVYLMPLAWSKEMSADSIRRTRFYVGPDRNKEGERGVAGKAFVDETIEVVHFTLDGDIWRADHPDYITFESNRRLPYRSCVAIPIGGRRMEGTATQERCLGVLCFDSPTPDVFDSDDIKELLGALSGGVRAALHIYRQLERGANVADIEPDAHNARASAG